MNRLIFLGTGGGGNVMFSQARKTGGIFLELGDNKIIIDPGPGSLVHSQALKLNPRSWNIMLLSHLHPDHTTDANVLLGGMKEPILIAEKSCLDNCITKYHKKRCKKIYAMQSEEQIETNNLKISSVKCNHYDPTIGFVIADSKRIGYVGDGQYYKGQEKHFEGADVLIMNILIPSGKEKSVEPGRHMSVSEAIQFIKGMKEKPALTIIQHFSFWMLKANVWSQAKLIEKETNVKTIAAQDFMELDLEKMKTRTLHPEQRLQK